MASNNLCPPTLLVVLLTIFVTVCQVDQTRARMLNLGPESKTITNLQFNFTIVEENKTITNYQFYLHGDLNRSIAANEAQADTTDKPSSTLLRTIGKFDGPITEGLDSNSKQVGRAQGMFLLATQNDVVLTHMTIAIDNGAYSGSSISFLGMSPVGQPVKELSVVRATDRFRSLVAGTLYRRGNDNNDNNSSSSSSSSCIGIIVICIGVIIRIGG